MLTTFVDSFRTARLPASLRTHRQRCRTHRAKTQGRHYARPPSDRRSRARWCVHRLRLCVGNGALPGALRCSATTPAFPTNTACTIACTLSPRHRQTTGLDPAHPDRSVGSGGELSSPSWFPGALAILLLIPEDVVTASPRVRGRRRVGVGGLPDVSASWYCGLADGEWKPQHPAAVLDLLHGACWQRCAIGSARCQPAVCQSSQRITSTRRRRSTILPLDNDAVEPTFNPRL